MTGQHAPDPKQPGKESGKPDGEWGAGVKQAGSFTDKERHGSHPPDTLHQGEKDRHPPKPKKH